MAKSDGDLQDKLDRQLAKESARDAALTNALEERDEWRALALRAIRDAEKAADLLDAARGILATIRQQVDQSGGFS